MEVDCREEFSSLFVCLYIGDLIMVFTEYATFSDLTLFHLLIERMFL